MASVASVRDLVGDAMERGESSVMTGTIASIGECYDDPTKVELRIKFGKEGDSSYVKLSKRAAKGFAVDDKVKVTTTVDKVG